MEIVSPTVQTIYRMPLLKRHALDKVSVEKDTLPGVAAKFPNDRFACHVVNFFHVVTFLITASTKRIRLLPQRPQLAGWPLSLSWRSQKR